MVSTTFTAALIRASLEGFAGLAASRLVSRSPAAASLDGIEGWRTYERNLLSGLASALDDDSPNGFAARSAWSRDAFAARGVSVEMLTAALACLREVLEESLPNDAWSPLPPYFERARSELAQPATADKSAIDPALPHARIAVDYATALLACDERTALSIVLDAVSEKRLTAQAALEFVIAPAQRELGRLWHLGQVSIADEHFATGISRRVIERVLVLAPRIEPKDRTILITSVTGDAHDIGVSIVSAFFELDGWRSISLGANTPIEDVVHMAERVDADVVALGATLDTQREGAAKTIAALRAVRPNQRVIVGGGAFKDQARTWQRIGADAFAGSAREALESAKRLVSR